MTTNHSSHFLATYHRSTKTTTYGFLASLPLLIAYEVLILLANNNDYQQVRVGADIWIKQCLFLVGVHGHIALGLAVWIVGITVFFWERKQNIVICFRFFCIMVLESMVYSIVLAVLISRIVSSIIPYACSSLPFLNTSSSADGFWLQIALSIGAGLYEELFFRVLLVSALYFFMNTLFLRKQGISYVVVALLGACIFSWVHYIGPFGDSFSWQTFVFRFLFGLAFNVLYILRGFGVVAWSHALYDVLLTISLPH